MLLRNYKNAISNSMMTRLTFRALTSFVPAYDRQQQTQPKNELFSDALV